MSREYRERREPKFNKNYRKALLIDAGGGGLCPKHGEYFGHGKHGLADCPFCDIEKYYQEKEPSPPPQNKEGEMKILQFARLLKGQGVNRGLRRAYLLRLAQGHDRFYGNGYPIS
jgi:hypothetical protein